MAKSIGVIGLGAMGLGVARSLLRAGFRTHACDVRPEVLAALAARPAAKGIGMIDAPVSGGAAKAASGQMTVMAAGRGGADDSAVVKNFPGIELPRKRA